MTVKKPKRSVPPTLGELYELKTEISALRELITDRERENERLVRLNNELLSKIQLDSAVGVTINLMTQFNRNMARLVDMMDNDDGEDPGVYQMLRMMVRERLP